jgi:hypothetical protein
MVPLTCPTCLRDLRLSRSYLRLTIFSALAFSAVVCFLLGFRGGGLLIAVVILWFPFGVMLNLLSGRIISPKFEAYPSKKSDGDDAILH